MYFSLTSISFFQIILIGLVRYAVPTTTLELLERLSLSWKLERFKNLNSNGKFNSILEIASRTLPDFLNNLVQEAARKITKINS